MVIDTAHEGVPESRVERLTREFYEWEIHGRGWDLWERPVELEPPFRPFYRHWTPPDKRIDDGRHHTWLSALVERIRGDAPVVVVDDTEDELPEPEEFDSEEPLATLTLSLPGSIDVGPAQAVNLLLALHGSKQPLSFEIVARLGEIRLQFTCRETDLAFVSNQLAAHLPDAIVGVSLDPMADMDPPSACGTAAIELALAREFMLPLRVPKRFDPDPATALFGALSQVQASETVAFQLLFHGAAHPWAQSVLRAVTDDFGEPFFADAPEFTTVAAEKVQESLFACVIRVLVSAETESRAWDLAAAVTTSLAAFSSPTGNQLIPLAHDDARELAADIRRRETRRSGMLLSVSELATLVHPPASSIRVPALRRPVQRTQGAPEGVHRSGLFLGSNEHRGKRVPVSLSTEARSRHIHVIGASGTGKSTLLLSLVLQDIAAGRGVAVLDPHGDLVEEILARVPVERVGDVVLFDPSDQDYPVGLNLLEAHSELERNLLASDLVAVFRRLSTSWGDQMQSVLANAIQAVLESERGGTLLDLRRFLIEKGFRDEYLKSVRDPEVAYFFQHQFPLLVGRPQGPIVTRLDTFLRPRLLRNMVGQKRGTLDFRSLLDDRKIFLGKLAQGLIGEENAALLGSILVTKFHQAALSRQNQAQAVREPFGLVIDEFQEFVTPSLASLLTGMRKYGLSLVLAHHELRQLASQDRAVLSAVLANPHTRIVFRVGEQDAETLAAGFAHFDSDDLLSLKIGQAIARIGGRDQDFNLSCENVRPVETSAARAKREEILTHSRAVYARPLRDVEEEIASAYQGTAEPVTEKRAHRAPVQAPAARSSEPQAASPPPSAPEPVLRIPAAKPIREPAAQTPGKGGPQHKYLQSLIAEQAESHGFRATIEKPLPEGAGSVDLALDRDSVSIAIEITVTTSAEHEAKGIGVRLASGYQEVALVSMDRRALKKVEAALDSLVTTSDRARVTVLTPEEIPLFLASRGTTENDVETVRGYKVRVGFGASPDPGTRSRTDVAAKVIRESLRRLKRSSRPGEG